MDNDDDKKSEKKNEIYGSEDLKELWKLYILISEGYDNLLEKIVKLRDMLQERDLELYYEYGNDFDWDWKDEMS